MIQQNSGCTNLMNWKCRVVISMTDMIKAPYKFLLLDGSEVSNSSILDLLSNILLNCFNRLKLFLLI